MLYGLHTCKLQPHFCVGFQKGALFPTVQKGFLCCMTWKFCLNSSDSSTCPHSEMTASLEEINDSVQSIEELESIREAYSLYAYKWVIAYFGPGREKIVISLSLEKLPEMKEHHLGNNNISGEREFTLSKLDSHVPFGSIFISLNWKCQIWGNQGNSINKKSLGMGRAGKN